jgi:metallo-beta-lactamase family protein
MKISFHGACREVTGSCVLVETSKTKFLFDCGMFQGEAFALNRNFDDFDFDPKSIDFVFLTHAHIDHSGRLPKLYKEGFRGKVYSTAATKDLARLMLADSSGIIAREASDMGVEPFYSEKDATVVMNLFEPLSYGKKIRISSDIEIRLRNAGHVLGSALFEVWVKEGGEEKKIVYTGDLGNSPSRIIKDAEFIEGADLVFMESTYAGVRHESHQDGIKMIRKAIIECIENKGTLMIPVFALRKTQEILYELNDLIENKKVPSIPVFLDSPLAIKITNVYEDYEHLYSEEPVELIYSGDELFDFPGLKCTFSVDESKEINTSPKPKIILAGSGMCTGGRISHHLKFNLSDPNSQVLLVAFQVKGSLGRKLLTGHKSVKIDNSHVPVKAKISVINSYSAHADHDALIEWVKKIKKPKPKHVFVMHGEEESSEVLAREILEKTKNKTIVPEYKQVYEF